MSDSEAAFRAWPHRMADELDRLYAIEDAAIAFLTEWDRDEEDDDFEPQKIADRARDLRTALNAGRGG